MGPIPGATTLPNRWWSAFQEVCRQLKYLFKVEAQAKYEPNNDFSVRVQHELAGRGSCAYEVQFHCCDQASFGETSKLAAFHQHNLAHLVADGNADYVYYVLIWPECCRREWDEKDLKARLDLCVSRRGPASDEIARVRVVWPPRPGGRKGGNTGYLV